MNQISWDKNRTTRSGELRVGIWGVEQSYVFSSSAGLIFLDVVCGNFIRNLRRFRSLTFTAPGLIHFDY